MKESPGLIAIRDFFIQHYVLIIFNAVPVNFLLFVRSYYQIIQQ